MICLELSDFELDQTLDCGQSFRWQRLDDADWVGTAGGRVLRVRQSGKQVCFDCDEAAFEGFWRRYFDLDRDYGAIKALLFEDPLLRSALACGSGIRLLNQAPFEMLITFILSANNHIPRITSLVSKLAQTYGEPIEHPWASLVGPLHDFPAPKALAETSQEALRALGLGYRDRYVLESARMVCEAPERLNRLSELPYAEAKAALMTFPGVGAKVADCILLFSAGQHEAFPVDTWIRKTLEGRFGLKGVSARQAEAFAEARFGPLRGFAQQYLFYEERQKNRNI